MSSFGYPNVKFSKTNLFQNLINKDIFSLFEYIIRVVKYSWYNDLNANILVFQTKIINSFKMCLIINKYILLNINVKII